MSTEDAEVVMFNKGGRSQRLALLQANGEAPREFLYGYAELLGSGCRAVMLSTAEPYPGPLGRMRSLCEQAFSRTTHLGLRLHHVATHQKLLRSAKAAISFTDGYSLTLGLYYRNRPRRGPCVIGGFHGLSDVERRAPAPLRPLVRRAIRRALSGLDHAFFFGPADRGYAMARYNLADERASVYAFGVDCEFWRPDPSAETQPQILAVGQDINRDYDTLAAAEIDVDVLIVAAQRVRIPPGRRNVRVVAGSYFSPMGLSDAELRRQYQTSLAVAVPLKDVYQPTGYSVTLQAMACGRPVILSDIKGLWRRDLLRHDENCLLVRPGDPQAIAEAVRRLQADPELGARLGRAARATVDRHFNLATVARSTAKLVALAMSSREGSAA